MSVITRKMRHLVQPADTGDTGGSAVQSPQGDAGGADAYCQFG